MTGILLLAGLFVVLTVGSVIATMKVMGRASRSYEKAKQRRAADGPAVACSTCGSTMSYAGLQDFRVGDGPEALGASNEQLTLEAYKCPTCRKVEFFLPPAAG